MTFIKMTTKFKRYHNFI